MFLAAVRPVTAIQRTTTAQLEPLRPALPAPVKQAVAAVAIGAALQVGLALASRYITSSAAQTGARLALEAGARKNRQVQRRPEPANEVVEHDQPAIVSETLFVRRLWIRR
jgi:hypothetical protein